MKKNFKTFVFRTYLFVSFQQFLYKKDRNFNLKKNNYRSTKSIEFTIKKKIIK